MPITSDQFRVAQPARGRGRGGGGGGGPMRSSLAERQKKKAEEEKVKAKKLIKELNKTEETLRLAGKPEPYAGSKYSEQRLAIATSQSKGVSFQTGFGPTTITYSGTGQVMVSSKKTDFGGTYKKGTCFKEYHDWAKHLDRSPQHRKQFARDILALMKNNHADVDYSIYTPEQKRAAALLITTTSTSEEFRVDGARKLARAALQMIIDHNKTFCEAFGDPGIYPMTGGQGTSYTRNLMETETQELTQEEVLLMSCMSPLRETDPDGS